MARKPFFSGNYGSALARVDTRPIVEAGRAQGQMFANMGSQIGGAIEKYGLNKEKQKKNQAFIKGQSNLLDMLSEQDPEQADRYAIMKEQLNNPDVSLTERAERGKQLMQNITFTNQMQNQMLNRETQEQALGLAKRTEDLTVENLKLGNRQKELGTLISGISLDKLNAIKDEDTRVALLAIKERGKDLLQGDKRRELEGETIASQLEVLPGQTSNLIKEQGLDSTNIDIAQSTIEQGGGVQGMAERNIKKDDLKIKAEEVGIKSKKKYMNYLDAMATKSAIKTPENTSIENSITEVQKEIDSIMSSPSFVRDEDGNALDIEDLVTITPITGEVEISEDANKFSKREINRLVELVKKKTNLRLGQKTIIIDGNGNQKEVTIADKERMTREKEAQLEAIEEARLRKEREESLKEAEQARLLF
tara:strand:+ start:10521 stop:11783 length:1263 start_codon:yes stop_codon:yes gene_type:complete